MSKLEELIQELCPDGVEYKTLGELGSFYGGLTGKSKKDFENGNSKFITYMNVFNNLSINTDVTERVFIGENEKQNTLQYGDVIFTGSSETPDECGMSSVLTVRTDEKLYLNSFCFVFRFNEPDTMEPEFSKYLFRSLELRKQIKKTASGVTRFNVSKEKMKRVRVPLAPLPIQREIVHILDNFTLLSAELSAELSARQKQYEYYRDSLLSFEKIGGVEKAKWLPLGDTIVSLNTGLNPRQFFRLNTDDANNYYVTIREIQNGKIVFTDKTDRINDEALRLCNNRSNLEIGDVLFSGTGTIGETAVIEIPPYNWNIKEGVYSIKPKKYVLNSRFLMYILRTELLRTAIKKKSAGGTVKSIPMAELKKIELPIPPLEIQERIVKVLDNFDAICSDLNIGLPAEIEARQKQYEYYRDMLLTFNANGETILTDRQD